MAANRRKFKGRLGEYEQLALLHKGSTTSTHLARRQELSGPERFVIYRELLPEGEKFEDEAKRFLREARVGTLFRHPNLVGTQESGKLKGTTFHITEFLLGDSVGYLAALGRASGKPLEPPIAAEIAAQAAEALQAVHTLRSSKDDFLGLVHQNLNPDNLVVLATGRVKPVNFVLSRKAEPPRSSSDPAYLSPEQGMGQFVDARTDVFLLGLVIWELLCGRSLFRRENDAATRNAAIACLLPPIEKAAPLAPPELQAIVKRALRRKPDTRFATAGEMAEALRRLPGVGPVEEGVTRIRSFIEWVAGDRVRAKLEALSQIEASEDALVDPGLLLPGKSADVVLKDDSLPTAVAVPSLPPKPSSPGATAPRKLDDPNGLGLPPEFLPDTEPVTDRRLPPPPELEEPVTEREIDRPKRTTGPAGAVSLSTGMEITRSSDPPEQGAAQDEIVLEPFEQPQAPPASPAPQEPGPQQPADGLPIEPSLRMRPWYDQYRMHAAIAGGVLLLLIIILAWPSADEPEAEPDTAAEAEPAEVQRSPQEVLAELEREAALAEAARRKKPVLVNLQVLTDPAGCRVELDGKELEGKTPLRNVFLPAGLEYEIGVACRGYEKESRRLTPTVNNPPVLEFYPPPAGSPEREFGRLQVDTRPKTLVYLGKKKLGQTPLLGVRIPVGVQELRFVNKRKRIDRVVKVTIEAGHTTTLRETF